MIETPNLKFSKQFLAFICFSSCKNGDIVKLFFKRVVHKVSFIINYGIRPLLFVFSNKSVFKLFKKSPAPWFSQTWVKPYLYNEKYTDEAQVIRFYSCK